MAVCMLEYKVHCTTVLYGMYAQVADIPIFVTYILFMFKMVMTYWPFNFCNIVFSDVAKQYCQRSGYYALNNIYTSNSQLNRLLYLLEKKKL